MSEDKLVLLLDKVISQLGDSSSIAFEAIKLQAMTSSSVDLFLIGITAWFFREVYLHIKKHIENDVDFIINLYYVTAAGVSLIIISNLKLTLAGLFNPTYWAIHTLTK